MLPGRRIEPKQVAPWEGRHEPTHGQLGGSCFKAGEFECDEPSDRPLEGAVAAASTAEADLPGRVLEVEVQPARDDL